METPFIGWVQPGPGLQMVTATAQSAPATLLRWADLLVALERGEGMLLDETAFGRARASARVAGLHLRPRRAEPPPGRAGNWVLLAAYDRI